MTCFVHDVTFSAGELALCVLQRELQVENGVGEPHENALATRFERRQAQVQHLRRDLSVRDQLGRTQTHSLQGIYHPQAILLLRVYITRCLPCC